MRAGLTVKRAFISTIFLVAAGTQAPNCAGAAGGILTVPTLGGSDINIVSLNSSGQLTGDSRLSSGVSHAFLFPVAGTSSDLGTLGGNLSFGLSINSQGQVAGTAELPSGGSMHAFLSDGTTMTDLGTLGGEQSTAVGVNDAGQVVGESWTADFRIEAFICENGTMRSLGHLGGGSSSAKAINQAGTVVGYSSTPTTQLGFIWRGGTMSDVGTLGTDSAALAVNNENIVAGNYTALGGQIRAFIYTNTMVDLGAPAGSTSKVKAMNNRSQVVGDLGIGGQTHGFVYEAGHFTDVGTLSGGNYSSARAANNLGQVVGLATVAGGANHAFLWENGVLKDLNDMLPAGSPWVLNSATAINDSGLVAGKGTYNGIVQGFVMTLGSQNQAPVASAEALKAGSSSTFILDGSGSRDPDGDPLSYLWTLNGQEVGTTAVITVSPPLGSSVYVLTVTDPSGASSQAEVTVEVSDTEPPVISSLTASPSVLTPPNHKPVLVTVSVVARDNVDPSPMTRIFRITSNQRLTSGEARVTGDLTAVLAATRSPAEGARTYTLHVESIDSSGNRSTGTVDVVVPHGLGNAANVK